MRLTVKPVVRVLFWAAIGICGVAVGLGRAAPRVVTGRSEAIPLYHAFNGRFFSGTTVNPRILDRQSGELLPVDYDPQDTLEYASCSPWRDERGQYHVACRWMTRTGEGNTLLPREFGLARFTLPEGRMIDRIALDVMPSGEPCWVRGSASEAGSSEGLEPKVLFVAGDGVIYRYTFPEAVSKAAVDSSANIRTKGDDGQDGLLETISWRAKTPGLGPVYIKDLVWPARSLLKGRLLAALSYQVQHEGRPKFLGPQLWWLELSDDGLAIVNAGRFTVPTPNENDFEHDYNQEERLPNVAVVPDGDGEGTLALTFLTRTRNQAHWELRLVPIENDSSGNLVARREHCRILCRHSIAAAPTFSADGRWVYSMVLNEGETSTSRLIPRRFPAADALIATDTEPHHDFVDQSAPNVTQLAAGSAERHAGK